MSPKLRRNYTKNEFSLCSLATIEAAAHVLILVILKNNYRYTLNNLSKKFITLLLTYKCTVCRKRCQGGLIKKLFFCKSTSAGHFDRLSDWFNVFDGDCGDGVFVSSAPSARHVCRKPFSSYLTGTLFS